MAKKIKSISFAFENVEVATVKLSDIRFLKFRGLKKDGLRVQGSEHTTLAVCQECEIVLKKSANKHYDQFGSASDLTLFDRLRAYSDVVFVTVNYKDGTHLEVGLPWSGTEETNCYQDVDVIGKQLKLSVFRPRHRGGPHDN